MTAPIVNLALEAGSDKSLTVTCIDNTGAQVSNTTGYGARMQLRDRIGGTLLGSLTIGNGITNTGTNFAIDISAGLTATMSATVANGVYDVFADPSGGPANNSVKIQSGNFTIVPAVTDTSGIPINPGTFGSSTLQWTQGGTVGTPTNLVPFRVQPVDVTKAPFEWWLSQFTNSGGPSTYDSIFEYGYNSSGNNASEPQAFYGIEQDWWQGARFIEMYTQVSLPGGSNATRAFFVQVNRSTLFSTTQLSLGAVTGGSFQLTDNTGNTKYYIATDLLAVYTRNNYPLYFNDTGATSRTAITLDATNTFKFGDPAIKLLHQGSQFAGFRSVSAAYTIDASGLDAQIKQTTANNVVLPNPANSAGRQLEVWATVGGATLKRFGSEQINGASSDVAMTANKLYIIRCDGTNWWTT